MKLQRILAGVLLLFCFSVSKAETSQNLIDPQAWDGATYGNDPGGCCTSISGSGAMIDNTSETIMFSYGRDVLAQTIAINQALALSGISVDGYQYEWTYRLIGKHGTNNYYQVHNDTLQFIVTVKDANGNQVERYVYDRSGAVGQTIAGSGDWQTESGTELFQQSYQDPQNIQLQIIGADGGYWAGYYGPEVKDIALRLIYSADPCSGNPLFDPSCKGYAEALAKMLYDQNCAANPLYDSGCPGYATAYFNQQCSVSPLYNQACPGYAEAYYDQQCSANPLYDSQCPGYAQAYEDQQCTLDPFYNTTCPGYAAAYYNQQCTLDTLYDSGCDGYESAYYEKYIKPQLEEQTAQASGTDTTSATSTNTSIPTVSSTGEFNAISLTGDSVVDSFISGGTANDMVASYTPAQESTPAPTETPQQSNGGETVGENQRETEGSNEATTGEVSQNEPESISDSSADVEEQMGDGGGEDSAGSEAGSDEKEDNATGGNSKSKSSSDSRRDKMKKAMTEKAMALADDMSKAATIEAQKAVQAQVLAVMSYVPGFGSYGGTIGGGSYSDAQMYAPTTVPESKRGLRNGLAQQLLHTKMVDSQYKESD